MTPDLEKRLKEEMESASLQEVMPGFDAEQEWHTLDAKLRPGIAFPKMWRYAAAVAALILLGTVAAILFRQNTGITNKPAPVNTNETAVAQPDTDRHNISNSTMPLVADDEKHSANTGRPEQKVHKKYMISNSTDCPMEISISQTMKCPDSQPAAISTSSTLEPGQSAPLGYKETESVPKNCSLTIEQIEIKSISTGEAITLDAHSSPSTAGEVFSYISGEKRGDVLAGVFNLDCNKHTKKHSLRLNNRAGSVVMQ